MRWTEYWRIKEQAEMVEDSIKRVRQVLKSGAQEAVDRETVCLRFNLEILLEFRKSFLGADMDMSLSRLEIEAQKLLDESHSYMEKQHMEVHMNGKTSKNI